MMLGYIKFSIDSILSMNLANRFRDSADHSYNYEGSLGRTVNASGTGL